MGHRIRPDTRREPQQKTVWGNLIALIREWFKDLAEFLLWCRKADIPLFPSAIVAIGEKANERI